MGFNNPTAQTEDLYIKSINTTVDRYRALLEEVGTDKLVLLDYDLDSGNPTKIAEYSLTDETYSKLLGQLAKSKFDRTTPELRSNVLEFYSNLSASTPTKDDKESSADLLAWLNQLKAASLMPTTEPLAAR